MAFPRFLVCTCFSNGQVLFYEHRYTCRNGACAQARSAQLPIERNEAFPVSPARDKGVPNGAEAQTPVALRGTCFVMRQVLFYAEVSGFDRSSMASSFRGGLMDLSKPLTSALKSTCLITKQVPLNATGV